MKRVILIAILLLLGASSLAFGQEFGETSTTNSYTEQLEVRTPSFFASEIRKALSFNGFREVRETSEAVFLSRSIQTNSGYIQNYDVATVWVRSDSTVRLHIWRKRSNLRKGEYQAWSMPENEIVNYRRVLNEYFQSNQ